MSKKCKSVSMCKSVQACVLSYTPLRGDGELLRGLVVGASAPDAAQVHTSSRTLGEVRL
jgi:hypothetical protein